MKAFYAFLGKEAFNQAKASSGYCTSRVAWGLGISTVTERIYCSAPRANSWSALDVYNESQGRVELPLLFHCVCVIGVLYSEHQAQLLPAPPPHTNVVLTTRGFYYAIASEPSVPTDGHRNTKHNLIKAGHSPFSRPRFL